ncbi:type IX secretion component PorD family protein [Hymenobacter radiodurans]|uniref:type IX secretion component PorD family protein n=1 Tax=Hymenobacter radiodurans TaxID=2496028 RepID=UPI0010586EFF|nr:DUF4835 family protein [Hymenobacter radiodurans]
MRNLLFAFCCLFLLLVRPAQAQELLAEVSVTTENVTIADQQLVQQMRTDIQSFLNTRTWTNVTYRPEERIRFRLFVGITAIPQTGSYKATARIITERPVYGTGYQTNLLSFADRGWSFNYSPRIRSTIPTTYLCPICRRC